MNELTPGVERAVATLCLLALLALLLAVRPWPGFWDWSRSELFDQAHRWEFARAGVRRKTGQTVANFLNSGDVCLTCVYSSSERLMRSLLLLRSSSAPLRSSCTSASVLLTAAHNVSLFIISQPRRSMRLRPIILTRHTNFYNWVEMFSCSPLITFEPSNIEECRLVFTFAHREYRTVRVVGARLSPGDIGRTTDFMLRTHRMNKIHVGRDMSALRPFTHMSPGRC